MRIAVEGCAHGELEIIYNAIQEMEKVDRRKVDLLICCGDFQSTRNLSDLKCMAVPDKYKEMCTFYKYYSGEKVAPILTIFIGGNHEASNYLQELPYGGWVAPNIYYLGYAGVVTIGGIRIAGLSGIYKSQHLMQGRYEKPPYNDGTIRSVYHVRNLDVFRLKQLTGNIDIFLSHDWPTGVTKHGDVSKLLTEKPFFRNDIETDSLGSPPNMELLKLHYPSYWFSAHLHCKFAAIIPEAGGARATKFLALDKCLPRRKFLQILELEHDQSAPLCLQYDLEWLTILYLTNHLLSVKSGMHYMPGQGGSGRWLFTPTTEEKEKVLKKFNYSLQIPQNFTRTAKPYNPEVAEFHIETPQLLVNKQTTQFCDTLGIDDPSALLAILMNNKDCRPHEASYDASYDTSYETSYDASYDQGVDGNDAPVSFDEESVLDSTYESNISSSTLNRASPVNASPVNASPVNASPKSSHSDHDSEYGNVSKEISEGVLSSVVSIADSTNDNNGHNGQIEPNCKKFKRRNYSLYSNTL